jgi:hypothetical protein
MTKNNSLVQFKSRSSLLIGGIAGLVLAYLVASRAIDTGSWWEYLGTALIVIFSIRALMRSRKIKKND